MAILPIIEYPNPFLKKKSLPVEAVDDKLRTLFDNMLETMYLAPGIGLSAVQVGKLLRVVVIDLQRDDKLEPLFLANPVVTWASEETGNYKEGCLSVPSFYEDVTRPKEVKVAFLDYNGNQQEIHCDGLLATCVQHEIDHLDGKVFLDRISKLKKDIITRKIKKGMKGEPR